MRTARTGFTTKHLIHRKQKIETEKWMKNLLRESFFSAIVRALMSITNCDAMRWFIWFCVLHTHTIYTADMPRVLNILCSSRPRRRDWTERRCAAWELRKRAYHIIQIKLLIDKSTLISWHRWEWVQNQQNRMAFSFFPWYILVTAKTATN